MRLRDRLMIAGVLSAGAGLMAVREVRSEWSAERMEAAALRNYGFNDLPNELQGVRALERDAYARLHDLTSLSPGCAVAINPGAFRRDVATIVEEPCELTGEQITELREYMDFYTNLHQQSATTSNLLSSQEFLGELDDRIRDGESSSVWDIFDTEGTDERDLDLYFTSNESIASVQLDSYEKSFQEYVLELLLVASAICVLVDLRKISKSMVGFIKTEYSIRRMYYRGSQLSDVGLERELRRCERRLSRLRDDDEYNDDF